MIQLASFALHKLFTEWEYEGHSVPQLKPANHSAVSTRLLLYKQTSRAPRRYLGEASISYSLYHQLPICESLVKIGSVVSQITRNKLTDKYSKKTLFWKIYCVYEYIHCASVKSVYLNIRNGHSQFLSICIDHTYRNDYSVQWQSHDNTDNAYFFKHKKITRIFKITSYSHLHPILVHYCLFTHYLQGLHFLRFAQI